MAPGLDFNNDGVLDFVRPTDVSTYSWPTGSDPVEYEKTGAQDAPHIGDPAGKYPPGDMAPFDERNGLTLPDHVSAWYTSGFNYHRMWNNPAIRFFNKNRSMSFVPGDRVRLRNDPASRVIEGIVVFYDFKSKRVWNSALLDFGRETERHPSEKRFVSIDDVVWLTAQGQPLDMQKAVKITEMEENALLETAKSAQGEMNQLIRAARRKIKSIPTDQESQKRRIVLDLIEGFPYQKDLPAGWQTSILFALGLKPEYLD